MKSLKETRTEKAVIFVSENIEKDSSLETLETLETLEEKQWAAIMRSVSLNSFTNGFDSGATAMREKILGMLRSIEMGKISRIDREYTKTSDVAD